MRLTSSGYPSFLLLRRVLTTLRSLAERAVRMGFLFEITGAIQGFWFILTRNFIPAQALLLFSLPFLWCLYFLTKQWINQGYHGVPLVGKGTYPVSSIWGARIQYIAQGFEMIKEGHRMVGI